MNNPLENWERYAAFNEVYEIVKSVVVVGKNHNIYRVDIQMDHAQTQVTYDAKYYIEETFTVQPTYPQTGGEFDRVPEKIRVWKVLSFMPSIRDMTLEKTLDQALRSLAETAKGPSLNENRPSPDKVLKLIKSDQDIDNKE